ncbi:MAG: hypothetical protein AAGF02_18160 [Actinomycetota bacterium]
MPTSTDRRSWTSVVGAVLRRPRLWPVAIRQLVRLRPPGWWRRRPFLPVPDRAWRRWRLTTVYGDDAPPTAADVVTWLEWRRRWDHGG